MGVGLLSAVLAHAKGGAAVLAGGGAALGATRVPWGVVPWGWIATAVLVVAVPALVFACTDEGVISAFGGWRDNETGSPADDEARREQGWFS